MQLDYTRVGQKNVLLNYQESHLRIPSVLAASILLRISSDSHVIDSTAAGPPIDDKCWNKADNSGIFYVLCT